MRNLAIAGVGVLLLISLMTFLRAPRARRRRRATAVTMRDSTANALVYNRNFGDMETAARIINNVPDVIPYQNGKPMLGWALAPIPRSLWPAEAGSTSAR